MSFDLIIIAILDNNNNGFDGFSSKNLLGIPDGANPLLVSPLLLSHLIFIKEQIIYISFTDILI
jgi:hypothetical protein